MTAVPDEPSGWYSVPEAAELLGVRDRDVRAMLRDRRLLAVPHGPNSARSVPADLLLGPEVDDGPGPLPNLRGTLIVLADAGYDDEESFRWLYSPHEELGSTPVAALRARRTHAVRRVAQTLGF
ncbi:Rv2175c family DNA-binding protein [Georgenia alba]|uniref:Rv2175c family DNA-binding protein n=1 Tax=Georgenia alba TaxID=2233858 RepID=A0ABW2QDQ7_9MICO